MKQVAFGQLPPDTPFSFSADAPLDCRVIYPRYEGPGCPNCGARAGLAWNAEDHHGPLHVCHGTKVWVADDWGALL